MRPEFHATDGPALAVFDPVQRRRFVLETPTRPRPSPVGTDGFVFPVERAVEITTDRVALPYVVSIVVRDAEGGVVAETGQYAYEELPEGQYVVELHAPVKLYLRVESELTVASSLEYLQLQFGAETAVRVGARSHHHRPAATVTTTDDPRDVMAAVSTFGSALKTTSPERSFPTLRGHPPRIELGDSLDVPSGLDPPETGVHVEVPPERATVYSAGTLAYYLGADVRPGDEPKVVTDDGFERSLDGSDSSRSADDTFATAVERTLKQVVFLDCLTRTEGFYPVDLHERRTVEDVRLDFAALYDAPLAERLAAYLSVPFERIRDAVPKWRLTAYATPEPENVELLPYVVDELAVVEPVRSAEERGCIDAPSYVDDFVRSTAGRRGPSSTASRRDSDADADRYVTPPETDSLERAWMGSGRPFGANKLLRSGFENREQRIASNDAIDIVIVCNDEEMRPEYEDGTLYGDRTELPFDVTVHDNCSTDALADALSTDADFLHYIGHIEPDGFRCPDGTLDASTVDGTVETFFLNGCNSYEQGRALVENGSVGGIVTHGDVGNRGAIAIGRSIAQSLNAGFSLRSALEIGRNRRIVANQYTVVGDGGVEIAQNESGTPVFLQLESGDSDAYRVTVSTYPTAARGIGSLYTPFIEGVETYFLTGGPLPEFRVSSDALLQSLHLERMPVTIDGEFRWSTDVDREDLRDRR